MLNTWSNKNALKPPICGIFVFLLSSYPAFDPTLNNQEHGISNNFKKLNNNIIIRLKHFIFLLFFIAKA